MHIKRCSIPLVIKKMQIKTTARQHYVCTTMTKINRLTILSADKSGATELSYC